MSKDQWTNSYTVSRLTAHLVWSTKYRYSVLKGDLRIRCRGMLIQVCESEDVNILNIIESQTITEARTLL